MTLCKHCGKRIDKIRVFMWVHDSEEESAFCQASGKIAKPRDEP